MLCCAVLCSAVLCCALLCCAVLLCSKPERWKNGVSHFTCHPDVLDDDWLLIVPVLKGVAGRIRMHQPVALPWPTVNKQPLNEQMQKPSKVIKSALFNRVPHHDGRLI